MNQHQVRVRLFGALFAGVVGFGAAHAVAAEVQAFDTVEDAYAAEAEQFADQADQQADRNTNEAAEVENFGHHPGNHPGHHPGHPGYPFPTHHGRFVCVAQNVRGQAFYGTDRFEYQAQQEALRNCYRSRSARCFVVSCRHEMH